MGGRDGPDWQWFHTISREEELAQERELKKAKTCIKNIFKNANKNQLKGLDALLSVLSDLSKSDAPIIVDEGYVRGEMKNLDYKLKDVEDIVRDERLYEGIETTESLGIVISAAINNVIKPGEKVYIKSIKPVDNLFYNLKDAEGHVDIAGNYLGENAVNSNIFARKAGDAAGHKMKNSEMHIYKAANNAGFSMEDSKIYVNKAGERLGGSSERSLISAKKADAELGWHSFKSKIYVDKAGYGLGAYATDCEIHFNEARDNAAMSVKRCKVYGKKAGEDFGARAFESKMYVDELGYNAGLYMQYSEIHFKKLDGALGKWDPGSRRRELHNKLYKNGLPFVPFYIIHAIDWFNCVINDYLRGEI